MLCVVGSCVLVLVPFSGVRGYRRWGGRKLQFSDRQRHISDRGDSGCKSSILPLNSPKLEIFRSKFCTFGRKFSEKLKFRGRQFLSTCCPATRPVLATRLCVWSAVARRKAARFAVVDPPLPRGARSTLLLQQPLVCPSVVCLWSCEASTCPSNCTTRSDRSADPPDCLLPCLPVPPCSRYNFQRVPDTCRDSWPWLVTLRLWPAAVTSVVTAATPWIVCRKIFYRKKNKIKICDWKSPILGDFRGKIETLSTHSLQSEIYSCL